MNDERRLTTVLIILEYSKLAIDEYRIQIREV